MKGYGVIQAYLHDIGMVDLSHFGRTMHPEYAAQAGLLPGVRPNCADSLGGKLRQSGLAFAQPGNSGALAQPPLLVPCANCSPCRSVTTAASAGQALNDRARLRAVMQTSVGVDLDSLYQRKQAEANRQKLSQAQQAGQSQALIEPLVQALRAAESDLTSPQAAARQTHYQNRSVAPPLRRFCAMRLPGWSLPMLLSVTWWTMSSTRCAPCAAPMLRQRVDGAQHVGRVSNLCGPTNRQRHLRL